MALNATRKQIARMDESNAVQRYEPKAMGRPTKLNPELIERVATLIRQGNFIDTACKAVGISRQTYHTWLKEGGNALHEAGYDFNRIREPRIRLAARFSDACARASAEAEANGIASIARHAEDDWRAAAWHLERRYPRKWGAQKQQLEVTGPGGGAIQWEIKLAPGAPPPSSTTTRPALTDPDPPPPVLDADFEIVDDG